MTMPHYGELSLMNTIPDRFSPWASQPFREELESSRSINKSIVLTAAAAIWFIGIPPAAAYQLPSNDEMKADVSSKDSAMPVVQDQRSLLIDTLLSYARLGPAWDGSYDDEIPSKEAVFQASTYIEKLPHFLPLPEASVASDGEIILFWKDEDFYLDVGFRGNENIVYFGQAAGEKVKGLQDFDNVFSSSDKLASFLISANASNQVQL
jgi:hypothetical protein